MNLLRSLRYFVTVVEEEHFGHAADRLGMTQPPLSQGIKRLEAHLGVRLLNRDPGGVSATDAGAALLDEARRLLEAEDRILALAATVAESSPGVRLGIDRSLPPPLVAGAAVACAGGPGEHVDVTNGRSNALVDAVRGHTLDIGVIVHPSVTSDLDGSGVHRLRTWLLLPAAAAEKLGTGPTTLRRALSLPLAVAPRDGAPAAHDLLVDTLLEHGCRHGTRVVADERSTLAMVATAQVCALTADPSLTARDVAVVPVPDDLLPLRVRVVWRRGSGEEIRSAAERIEREIAACAEPRATRGTS